MRQYLQQEEQQVDETYEQFEERVLNKRAAHMYHAIKAKIEIKDRLTLADMAYKNSRKQVRLQKILIPSYKFNKNKKKKRFLIKFLPFSINFQVAQKFYTLLVLKKFQVLELHQEYSYADIVVTKGPKWENPAL